MPDYLPYTPDLCCRLRRCSWIRSGAGALALAIYELVTKRDPSCLFR
jgi:hypothetical protein